MSGPKTTPNGFPNWCCCVLGLRVAQTALETYLTGKCEELLKHLIESCGTDFCKDNRHTIENHNRKLVCRNDCIGDRCHAHNWIEAISTLSRDKNFNIKPITTDELIKNPKYLQMMYIGKGYDPKKTNMADVSALLQFITNCKAFDGTEQDGQICLGEFTKEEIEQVKSLLELRNALMHSTSFALEDTEKSWNYQKLKVFIEIQHFRGITMSNGVTAQAEMLSLSTSNADEKGPIWDQVTDLKNIYRTLRAFLRNIECGCSDIEGSNISQLLTQAENAADDGWDAIKKQDISFNQRCALADNLKYTIDHIRQMEKLLRTNPVQRNISRQSSTTSLKSIEE